MRSALATIGIALGLVIAIAAGGAVAPLLYEISPRDPVVLITVAVTLLLAAAAAGLVPASRAARIGPGAALRAE
jgi:ABC-type antimicrobial peptide transport system permease subunit